MQCPLRGGFTSAALGYLSGSRWGAAWRAARGRRLGTGCRPSPGHCCRELRRSSSNLRPTSSSPERILPTRLGRRPASLREPRGPALSAASGPGSWSRAEAGCAGPGLAWSAASGRQAGSNGPPGIFPRPGERGSAPRISQTPPVAWSSNKGLGGGQRGFLLRVAQSPVLRKVARRRLFRTRLLQQNFQTSPAQASLSPADPQPHTAPKSSPDLGNGDHAPSMPSASTFLGPSGEWHFPCRVRRRRAKENARERGQVVGFESKKGCPFPSSVFPSPQTGTLENKPEFSKNQDIC